ncbi:hypothetical protein IAI53_03140 [Thauera sp. CAU 1555]|uniref:Helix-turn-helix domain-containing protein n=1 Tax=Thauera sedimentorum TaxID=2767595 RepID=A0ABR9B669_9RHOO|nr:hypothetical protein [Thauera sedimentorum]MBC9070949.1 hypothetical protein [Thauera sedimentorum]MBD8501868.1 hypothetical protein [Thauera sedimentorum]
MQAQAIKTQRTDYASVLRNYSTEEAAALLKIRPQTLRAAVCRDGHYAGIRPHKLPSRFLAWPAADVERLLSGEAAQ